MHPGAHGSGGRGIAGRGDDLAAVEGDAQRDDVSGVDQPRGAGGRDDGSAVPGGRSRRRGGGGEDGDDSAGAQDPLAHRVQVTRGAAGHGGDDQGGLPGRESVLRQAGRTFSACGPFCPWVVSNSTFWFSSSDR